MSISPIRCANRRSRNWSIGVPQCGDCPSQVFSTATKIATTAKAKLRAQNMCAHPLSDARASIDQLPWIVFDAASRTCPPMGRQDKCGVAIIWCTGEPSDAEEDQG
jgi:hypothetical protein